MKLSAKSRYGILGLIEVYNSSSKISIAKIAEKHNISNKFLENCFSDLKKAGLLKSRAGAGGGYVAVKSADEISLFDIVYCLEGSCTVVDSDFDDSAVKDFVFNNYWAEINNALETFLKTKKLSEYL